MTVFGNQEKHESKAQKSKADNQSKQSCLKRCLEEIVIILSWKELLLNDNS